MYLCVCVCVCVCVCIFTFSLLTFISAPHQVLVDLQTQHEKVRTEKHALQATIDDYKSQSEDALSQVKHRKEHEFK
jgi:hypothetical protein